MSKELFIVGAKRTAFGAFGGTLKNHSAVKLGVAASKAAIAQIGDRPELIDSVIFGNVSQTTTDVAYLARHVGLKSGVPIEAPALTVNRLCGSGFQSIINAAHEIQLGEANVVLAGGSENMSIAPYHVQGIRWGTGLGKNPPMVDSLWDTLVDAHTKLPMAVTAENLAEKYGVTRQDADEAAIRSQERWAAAQAEGRFDAEITPIMVKDRKKGEVAFEVDEHPKPQTTFEKLQKLPSLFKKDGVVSAGNASGISDGAGALIVASGEATQEHGFTPLARIVSYAVCGVPPEIMGYGPVPAINMALQRANLSIEQMDLVEINEAFAAQFKVCANQLNLDMEKTNINGGAVAIGHPTGASGSRIMSHLTYELQRTGGRYAVGSACIGGGQGIAIVIERC